METDIQGNDHPPSCLYRSDFSQALVLLEYLVKNGAERVVDEARSHMATIKILRNFHFIDEKGKDQGINGKKLAWTMLITNGTKLTLYEILTST
jgi:hypothetical protein